MTMAPRIICGDIMSMKTVIKADIERLTPLHLQLMGSCLQKHVILILSNMVNSVIRR